MSIEHTERSVLGPERLSVQPVRSYLQKRHFVGLPWLIQAEDSAWRPSLKRTISSGMSAASNPFHAEAEVEHFVCYRRSAGLGSVISRPVGRISATIDHEYVRRYGEYGFFGFFESVDDATVATALLNTAEKWVAARGMTVMTGPYSYSPRQEIGLLIDGFEHSPTLMQPHNPRYYARLLLGCGYLRRFDIESFEWSRDENSAQAVRLEARARRVSDNGRIRVRAADLNRYDEELELLRGIYNDSFRDHPEHVPITPAVFGALAKDLKLLLDPDLVRIVEVDGIPSGFSLLVPDLNQIVPRSGRLTPALIWRLLAKRDGRLRGVDTAVVVMIGVSQSLVGLGVGRVVAGEIARAVLGGKYRRVTTTWVHESNHWSKALVAQMKSPATRRYRVYERTL